MICDSVPASVVSFSVLAVCCVYVDGSLNKVCVIVLSALTKFEEIIHLRLLVSCKCAYRANKVKIIVSEAIIQFIHVCDRTIVLIRIAHLKP